MDSEAINVTAAHFKRQMRKAKSSERSCKKEIALILRKSPPTETEAHSNGKKNLKEKERPMRCKKKRRGGGCAPFGRKRGM